MLGWVVVGGIQSSETTGLRYDIYTYTHIQIGNPLSHLRHIQRHVEALHQLQVLEVRGYRGGADDEEALVHRDGGLLEEDEEGLDDLCFMLLG